MSAPNPLSHGHRLALLPELASIRTAGDWLKKVCAEFGVPASSMNRLDICLHEALANVLAHGGAMVQTERIVLDLSIYFNPLQGEARLEVRDAGHAFNPLLRSPKSATQSLETVEPGGLGILMLRSNADLLEYKREHNLNQLSIGVRWTRADG